MKAIILLFVGLFLTFMLQAQVSKTVVVTAGNLKTVLTATELSTVTNLIVTGTIDALDFKTMRDDMPVLAELDMSDATITAYKGVGTSNYITNYYADVIPPYAFYDATKDVRSHKISLKSVLIPFSTKAIGIRAFFGCSGLTSFSIPSSVTAIHPYAFGSCKSLTSISIPASVISIGNDAFNECYRLTSVTIPSSVDSIKSSTFRYCRGLVTVYIPSSVRYIGNYAFSDCSSLESVTIPSPVTSIGDDAFSGCNSLVSLTLSPNLTSIGESAFSDCTSLTGPITLPQGVTSIKYGTFDGCSSLTSVVIPSSVDSIEFSAFYNCISLKALTLPSALVYIGTYAFYTCSSLTGTLSFPPSLAYIGESAFYGCSGLTGELIIPPRVTAIQFRSFADCTGLTSLTIPSTVISIGQEAFYRCSSLTSIEVHHLIPLSLYAANNVFEGIDKTITTLHVPFGTKERYATAYGWKDFSTIVEGTRGFLLNSTTLSFDVNGGIDSTLHLIANFAWKATSDQTWLTVTPSSGNSSHTLMVSTEANVALSSRKGIITLNATGVPSQIIHVSQASIPLSVNIIPGGLSAALVYEEKRTIAHLIISGTIDARDIGTISDEMPLLAILDMGGATIAAYYDTLTPYPYYYPENTIPSPSYGDYHTYNLAGLKNLTSVILPSSLVSIGLLRDKGNGSFSNCINLTSIVIPPTVTDIGYGCFSGCTSLTSIDIPPSVTNIRTKAFYGCKSLTSIELPLGLTTIQESTFSGCNGLNSITIPPTIVSINSEAFFECTQLQSVVMPASVTSIGMDAFYNCSSLSSVVISSSVTTISMSAFFGCSGLTSLTIPSSVNRIEEGAFFGCINLTSIYANNNTPIDLTRAASVFYDVNKEACKLYVPYGSSQLYAAAAEWKYFTNIIEMAKLKLSETTANVEAAQGSTATVEITSDVIWTASCNQPWLTVNPASGNGSNKLAFIANANSSPAARTAIVTFNATGAYSQTILITQQTISTGLNETDQNIAQFKCYPNPFMGEMTIEIQNPQQAKITVDIYNMAGQRIKNLAIGNTNEHLNLMWNGTNEGGQQVQTGVYICKVNNQSRQMIFGGQKGTK